MERVYKTKDDNVTLIIKSEAFMQDVVMIHNIKKRSIIKGTGFLKDLKLTELKDVANLCGEQLFNPELSDLSLLDKEKLEKISTQCRYNIERLLKNK